ncbi:MAG: hypothetical protein UV04_C0028G0006 [Candidatus Gottesmanbacteria bacterium GW2011_GWA2_42_16]|nr:MAG: hypothetical protein UV04_C0028G0006 [Candidatus Gottesmanbacteria bacterium GW2011_GWA2_42_16]
MDELKQRVADILHKLNIPQTKLKIEDLGKEASDPAFWQDQVRATAKMKELAALQKEVEEGEFLEMLVAEGNETELDKVGLKPWIGRACCFGCIAVLLKAKVGLGKK